MGEPERRTDSNGLSDEAADRTQNDLTYEEISTRAWAQRVAETFRYRVAGAGWEYYGTCPRCGHATSSLITRTPVIRDLLSAGPSRPEPVTVRVLTVYCQCQPGHAADHIGCGAYGNLNDIRFE